MEDVSRLSSDEAQAAATSGKEVAWDRVLSALAPEFLEDLQRRDVGTIREELTESGLLEVVLSGRMTEDEWNSLEHLPKEEYRLFLGSQIASQYLSRTLQAMRLRESGLVSALKNIERKISETHSVYERVKSERQRIAKESRLISEEIAECDRQLKSTTSPPRASEGSSSQWRTSQLRLEVDDAPPSEEGDVRSDDDDDSPWEDHAMPRSDHHIRSSMVIGSMTSSPMAKSSVFSGGFNQDTSSPKHSRSRASSGGTSTGAVTDDEVVLFSSTTTPSWFHDKGKETFFSKQPLEGIIEGSNDNIDEDIEEENNDVY